MGSLLKDILVRHQQWEEDVKRQGRSLYVSEPQTALIENDALPKHKSTSSVLSHSDDALPTRHSHKSEETNVKTRYRTRPPRLRTAVVNVNANHSNVSCYPTEASPPSAVETATTAIATASTVSASAGMNSALPATLALPFAPYPVQHEMCETIVNVLKSRKPHVIPVAVAEVPTGCGKTMALLSSVLQYQQELKRMTPKEAEAFLQLRRPPWQHSPQNKIGKTRHSSNSKKIRNNKNQVATDFNGATSVNGEDADLDDSDSESGTDTRWIVPRSFFKHFRINSQRKIRTELDVTGSQELRRRFLPPPCTIYYVTRTHAQLRQAVRELRRLHGASFAIRMNILGSRERYCIHPKVTQAKASHTLPVEGNNLGEVCDKLVSMGLCEMVDKSDELSCSAISGPIGHQHGQIWDVEDLVVEGTGRNMCPYYAARDLVFFADINFCTYPYVLDPLIRHETKMEAALKNDAIVIFDEAHNVPVVCQDALSLECPRSVLNLICTELEPLVSSRHTLVRQPEATTSTSTPVRPLSGAGHTEGFATMQYPRELHLGSYTLVEIFSFLHTLFLSISIFCDRLSDTGVAESAGPVAQTAGNSFGLRGEKRPRDAGGEGGEHETYTHGAELEHHVRHDMEDFIRKLNRPADARKRTPALDSMDLFQRAYSVIMSLGVTFNPFLFSVFGLSMLKQWLLLLRFFLQKSRAFVLKVRSASPAMDCAVPAAAPARTNREAPAEWKEGCQRPVSVNSLSASSGNVSAASCTTIEVRCLDGSLAFNHLLQSVHRVVLASGTLAPFTQLAQDLGIAPSQWGAVEGLHVVPATQYSLTALTSLPLSEASSATTPLRCTYTSLSDPSFLKRVARCVVRLAQTVQHSSSGDGGGVLFFVPNYAVLHSLATITREFLLSTRQSGSLRIAPPIPLFLEPRKAEALTEVLHQYQCHTQGPRGGTALFFSVYRGKVSEGIDFTDSMARLVICLGVPLQPLKSWKVIAQRAYSGPDWYTSDAVRAVNQALGRCLRHVRDYGAVVLLDERYAQAEYQQRLSRWCRATLRTESSLAELCNELHNSFTQWRHELGPSLTSTTTTEIDGDGTLSSDVPPSTNAAKKCGFNAESQLSESLTQGNDDRHVRLGTDQLPFQFVRRPGQHRVHHSEAHPTRCVTKNVHTNRSEHSTSAVHLGEVDAAGARTAEKLLQSPFACTAVKLLYETVSSTRDVSRQDLHAAVTLLAETFKENDDQSSSEGWAHLC